MNTDANLPKTDAATEIKPLEELSLEEKNRRAAEIARGIMNGANHSFRIEAVATQPDGAKEVFGLNVRVPNLGDESIIAQLIVLPYSLVNFDTLSADERAFARARATFEWLAVEPFEPWVPLDDEPRKRDDKTETAPDFSKGFAPVMRTRLLALYREYMRVMTRFQ